VKALFYSEYFENNFSKKLTFFKKSLFFVTVLS